MPNHGAFQYCRPPIATKNIPPSRSAQSTKIANATNHLENMIIIYPPPMIQPKIYHAKLRCSSIFSPTPYKTNYPSLTRRPVQKDSQCFKSSRNYDKSSPTPYDPMENKSCQIMVLFNIVDHPSQRKIFHLHAAPSPQR